jgi:hypothetical protein
MGRPSPARGRVKRSPNQGPESAPRCGGRFRTGSRKPGKPKRREAVPPEPRLAPLRRIRGHAILRFPSTKRKEVIQCLIVKRRVWRWTRPGPGPLTRSAPPELGPELRSHRTSRSGNGRVAPRGGPSIFRGDGRRSRRGSCRAPTPSDPAPPGTSPVQGGKAGPILQGRRAES